MQTMKQRTLLAASLICSLLFAASCDKLPENGKLDGMWQIMSVNYARNSGYDSLVNVKPMHVYLSFQLKLAQINAGEYSNRTGSGIILSRFKRSGSTLSFYNFYLSQFAADILITDSATTALQCIGINGIAAKFHIDRLDDNKLQLSSDYAQIICRKF